MNSMSDRPSGEHAREVAEHRREEAELARRQAEQVRHTQEQLRSRGEQLRGMGETDRVEAEEGRVDAESLRDLQERAREVAEEARELMEQMRAVAEDARAAANDTRVVLREMKELAARTRAATERHEQILGRLERRFPPPPAAEAANRPLHDDPSLPRGFCLSCPPFLSRHATKDAAAHNGRLTVRAARISTSTRCAVLAALLVAGLERHRRPEHRCVLQVGDGAPGALRCPVHPNDVSRRTAQRHREAARRADATRTDDADLHRIS